MSKRNLSPCDLARALFERGANVIPLSPASKEPAGRWAHWATHPQDWPDVERLFARADPNANIAALGGIHSQAVGDDWGYLALLDCDSRESLDIATAIVRDATGRESLTSLSARGGHVWLRTPQPVRSARWAGGELRGYRSYVVAPGSVHPSGVPYRWANDGAEILRCDKPLPGVPWAYVERDQIPRLAAAIMRGDERVIKRYATRSEVDWALILSLTNAGASFERVRALYLASKHEKHLDPNRRDFERRLMAEYLRAKEQGDRADYTQAKEMAERVRAWALSAEFKGVTPRTRETDRRVLLAHAERAIKAGKHEWHMSQRDIEQAAQVGLMTAQRATRRLIKAGWLTRRQGFVGQYAQSYGWGRAVSPVAHLHTSPASVCKCIHGETADYAAHPAFEQQGLGRHAARIFETLARQGEATAKQLVSLSGCSRPTVYRWLKLMLKWQLVGYDPSQRIYWACPERLDDVARYLETHHIPARRRARIERERAAFRRRLKRSQRSA